MQQYNGNVNRDANTVFTLSSFNADRPHTQLWKPVIS